jgi:cytochrome c oxidase subunit 4
MAITNDSGVRGTSAVSLADMTDEDQQLAASRRQGQTRGLGGMDVPVNAPPHDEPHVAPLWIMYGTFVILIGLTVATVGARFIDAGSLNIWIALGLAFLKAILVAMFFMHLWWDTKLNQLILVSTLLFLTIFIGIAIIDSGQYQPLLQSDSAVYAQPGGEAAN